MVDDPNRDFFRQLADPHLVERLFAHLPNVVFCLKDRHQIYRAANQAFADRLSLPDPSHIIGRTALELFPADLAASFTAQDEIVFRSDTALTDRLELITNPDGSLGWYLANKIPVHNRAGRVLGLAGISRDLRTPAESEYRDLARLVEHIHHHLAEDLQPATLAAKHSLSLPQLDRRMRRVFHLTTSQFIRKARIDHAARLLAQTNQPIIEIALSSGYGDQSAFTRQFKATVGLPPASYRQTHRPKP